MNVKILSGFLKGHKLIGKVSHETRPTAIILRKKFFDVLSNVQNTRFIDICCGTGAMGLEAWSRGAKEVILIEKDRAVISNLRRNINWIKQRHQAELEERPISIVHKDIMRFSIPCLSDSDTLLFCDPPYRSVEVYRYVVDQFLLERANGMLALEVGDDLDLKTIMEDGHFEHLKKIQQGKKSIFLFKCLDE